MQHSRSSTVTLLAILCFFVISSCRSPQLFEVVDTTGSVDEVFVKHWEIVGPFQFSPNDIDVNNPAASKGGLDHDYLAEIGCPEAICDLSTSPAIKKSRHLFTRYDTDDGVIPFDHVYPGISYSVAYACSIFRSPIETDLTLELGSGDGVRLWVNHKLLLATLNTVDRAAFKYTSTVTVHIHRGLNTIIAKVDHKQDAWALITSFVSEKKLRDVKMNALDGNLLMERIVQWGTSSLQLQPDTELVNNHRLEISDSRGRVVATEVLSTIDRYSLQLPHLHRGYYQVSVRTDATIARDSFYIGGIRAIRASLSRVRPACSFRDLVCLQSVDVMTHRVAILTEPRYYHPDDSDWQKKVLIVARQASLVHKCAKENRCRSLSGFLLQEYASQLDGKDQSFLVYRPPGLKAGFPLIVVMPYAESPQRPFLESSLISWPGDLEALAHAADRNRVAVVILNGRGTIGDAPIGEADVLEALADLRKIEPYDPRRLYLYGVCEGGRRALLLAEHNPTLFAAIGTYGPALTDYKVDANSAYWFDHFGVIALAGNLSNIPVVLARGDLDEQASPALTEQFAATVKEADGAVQSLLIHSGMHKQHNLEDLIFPRILGYRNKVFPTKIHLSAPTLNNGHAYWLSITSGRNTDDAPMTVDANVEGTSLTLTSTGVNSLHISCKALNEGKRRELVIKWNGAAKGECPADRDVFISRDKVTQEDQAPIIAEAFAHPFIAVLGTDTRDKQDDERAFLKRWEADFYSLPRTIPDTQLDPAIAAHYNVILIGIPNASTYAGALARKLSLGKYTEDAVAGHCFMSGNGSDRAAAFPNPIAPGNLIVFVQAVALHWIDKESDLAIGGRYPCAVWEKPHQDG